MKTRILMLILSALAVIAACSSCTKKLDNGAGNKCGVIISDSSYLFAGKYYFDVKIGSDTERVATAGKESYNHGQYCW